MPPARRRRQPLRAANSKGVSRPAHAGWTPAGSASNNPRRGQTPDILRHCVAEVVPTRPGSRRAALASAFAICTASLQDAGQIVPGTRRLTPRGAAKERHARQHTHHGALVRRFEQALPNDGPAPAGAALDAAVVAAAARHNVPANVRLSPPLRGMSHNAAPRLADLYTRPGTTEGWDARKHAVLAQLQVGEFRVETGPGGPYLTLPDGATFGGFPTYPNDARRAPRRGRGGRRPTYPNDVQMGAKPPVQAAYNDPVYGSWGVVLDTTARRATLYRYLGRIPFDRLGEVQWLPRRGRFDPTGLPTAVHPRVLDGLARALLVEEAVRAPLQRAVAGGDAFLGDAPTPDAHLDPSARAAYTSVAAAKCALEKAYALRAGTKARELARGRADHALEIAEAVMKDVCGDGAIPVPAGSACDATLGALERASSVFCSVTPATCPHRVSPATLAEWRGGAMPPDGPYETPREHAPGAVPRCFYHPDTQRRLALQADVTRRVLAQNPNASEAAVYAAVRKAESEHPLAETWARLDAEARASVADVAVGDGAGGDAGMELLRKFYTAASRDDRDAARALWTRLAADVNVHADFDAFYALDRAFWDVAHRAAHDAKNPGWLKWVHDQMKARALTIHCPTRRTGRTSARAAHANPRRPRR